MREGFSKEKRLHWACVKDQDSMGDGEARLCVGSKQLEGGPAWVKSNKQASKAQVREPLQTWETTTLGDGKERALNVKKRVIWSNGLRVRKLRNLYCQQLYWASLVAQTVKNLPAMQETWV